MQVNIRKIAAIPSLKPNKNVAAYARVSSGKDAMLHSLSAQISYYSELIQKRADWNYIGVYSDEAMTGTKDSRTNFQRMLNDCKNGKIDMIITKSISRFARNTVTLLTVVRELKDFGVDVYFEEQNIHSISSDGELMLTILASYAQEESLSASENQKWRFQKLFEKGILPLCFNRIYGYKRTADYGFEIIPDEAEIVKEIYNMFLDGFGTPKIADTLNKRGIPTEDGDIWRHRKIRYILSNERYIGDLLLQKYFKSDHITKKPVKNTGQRTQYFVQNNHQSIISRETYNAVQTELTNRYEKYYRDNLKNKYAFTGILICSNCGEKYQRRTTATQITWICKTFKNKGKANCPSKQIPDNTLMQEAAAAMGMTEFDESLFRLYIDRVEVSNGNRLNFVFNDGTQVERIWKDRSRSESWTAEMKENARRNKQERDKKNG